jgi:hexosaminidase
MPGHNLAAIASYPWLSCDGKPKEVSMRWGVYADGVVCPSKETTYTFFEDVLDEVCEIFPSEYIHIGGDEAPRKHWENCPDCQKKMKMLGLTREAELQSCLNERIEAYLNSKGRKIIGWDEILEGGVTKTATVMSWRGPKGGIAAAKQGNRVIMTPNTNCYLDYYQTSNPQLNGEKTAFKRHYLPLEQCFDLDPFAELTEQESEYVVGIQGNVWCEYMKTFDHVQFMILPRLSALAEVAWSKEKKNYDNFLSRMEKAMIPTYKYHGFVFAPFAFDGTERYKKTWEEYVPPID